jgi:hypothetical protein
MEVEWMVSGCTHRRDEDRPSDPTSAPRDEVQSGITRELDGLRMNSGSVSRAGRQPTCIADRRCAYAAAMQNSGPSRLEHVL